MFKLRLYNSTNLNKIFNKRPNETKFGESIDLLTSNKRIYENIKNLDVQYVLIGLSEDIGVLLNHGKPGSYKTWNAVLEALLNTQNNSFNDSKLVAIIGYFESDSNFKKKLPFNINHKKSIENGRKMISEIDKEVVNLVSTIIKAGKTPIIIGGGHNNAYGNIKGTSLALKQTINCINFDAHTDFRALEGRHSGNGFSYAFAEGFLDHYFVFGLHENYTPSYIFDHFLSEKRLDFNTYEEIMVRKNKDFDKELLRALKHIHKKPFGIEVDCDAIINIKSSAQSPSGFSVEKARQFIHFFGNHKKASYLHICEAIVTKKNKNQIGKLISYLITDFIRANSN